MERKKNTKNIGPLEGEILVFGGVYSNHQALLSMRNIAQRLGISSNNIICTGDVVAYCAEPEACVQEMIDWGVHCIAGNVEIQLREDKKDCGCDFRAGSRCDTFSQQWYPFAQNQLSKNSLEWMKSLSDFIRFQFGTLEGFVVHGSFHETAEYIFKSSPWETKLNNFKAAKSNLILGGHCGLPFNDIRTNYYWLNPGVIGMPANDGSSKVWYMTLKYSPKGEFIFSHQRFDYDYKKTAQLMTLAKLPASYALSLKTGLWDNTEILPPEETALSGKKISNCQAQ